MLLSIFPLALLALFIAGRVLREPSLEQSVLADLRQLFPTATDKTLTSALDRVRESSTSFGVFALISSVYVGSAFWGALDTAFCRIYHLRCRSWLEQKRFALVMLVVVLLFMAATVLVPTVQSLLVSSAEDLPLGLSKVDGLLYVGTLIAGLVLLFGILCIVYWTVPNERMAWRAVWPGALGATLAIGVVDYAYPAYLSNDLHHRRVRDHVRVRADRPGVVLRAGHGDPAGRRAQRLPGSPFGGNAADLTGVCCGGMRIVVVDEHPVVRAGVRALLEGRMDAATVSDAETVEAALEAAPGDAPDVIVLDPWRPGVDVAQTVSELRQRSEAPIVVFTSDGGARLLSQALEAGVKGYVRKDSPAEDLVRAIEAASAGEFYVDPGLSSSLMLDDSERTLSVRQREILQMLADGMQTEAVAGQLGLSTETVRTHTKRILAKLEASTRTEAVAIGLRHGLID